MHFIFFSPPHLAIFEGRGQEALLSTAKYTCISRCAIFVFSLLSLLALSLA